MNEYGRSYIAVFAAFSLSACASLNIASDPLPLTGRVETEVPGALPADMPFALDPVRADGFAALYTDPLLAGYLERALAANADLLGSRARLRAAEARTAQARAARLVTIGANASTGVATLLDDIDLSDSAGLGLSAGYDPDLFGGIAANIRGTAAREALQRAELAWLQRVILARTAQSYIEVIAAEAQLGLARENFEFLGETLRVSRARFEGGAIARADYALSEAEYENARASLFAQEGAVRDARRALASLIGAYANEDLSVANSLPTLSVEGLGLPVGADRAVLARYDVEAARLGVVAAVADVDAARAAALPGLSLSGGVSGGLSVADLFDIDTYIARLGAAIGDTLFDGGADAARIEAARAGIDAQLAAYEDRAREAYRELVAGFDRAAVLERRLAALDVASGAAETALELEGVRYDLGEAILLDVLTVQRRVNAIRSERIRTQSAFLRAAADAQLAGGPASR